LYSKSKSDVKCSRYDYGYPAIMNRFFGLSVETFSYLACSGDTSTDIAGQIEALDAGQDLVVMTAGGNDLCLVRRSKFEISNTFDTDIICFFRLAL
jgi:lysophospholipase L1-like esterase